MVENEMKRGVFRACKLHKGGDVTQPCGDVLHTKASLAQNIQRSIYASISAFHTSQTPPTHTQE